MNFASFSFAAFVIVGVLLFHAGAALNWRRGVLLGLSATFLLSFGWSIQSIWPVILFGAVVELAILVAARKPSGRVPVAIVCLIVLFLAIKGYFPFINDGVGYLTVGISYILFRAIQVLSDLLDGAVDKQDLNIVDTTLFLFSFLTLSAGPIQSFQNFRSQLAELEKFKLTFCVVKSAGARCVLGLLKMIVVAPYVQQAYDRVLENDVVALRMGLGASLFMLWIYVNFSGYMDVVTSAGRFFGFHLPENFNRPDRASNFLDIWNRWHITLSRTFLTYVFNPLVRVLLGTFPGRPLLAGILSYVCVFVLIGWWHGPGSHFMLSGLLFGAAAAITKTWQVAQQRKFIPEWDTSVATIVSGALGLSLCAVALVPTWPIFGTASEVVDAIGSPINFALIIAISTLAGIVAKLIGMAYDWGTSRLLSQPDLSQTLTHPIVVGVMLVIIFTFELVSQGTFSPAVYYQRF